MFVDTVQTKAQAYLKNDDLTDGMRKALQDFIDSYNPTHAQAEKVDGMITKYLKAKESAMTSSPAQPLPKKRGRGRLSLWMVIFLVANLLGLAAYAGVYAACHAFEVEWACDVLWYLGWIVPVVAVGMLVGLVINVPGILSVFQGFLGIVKTGLSGAVWLARLCLNAVDAPAGEPDAKPDQPAPECVKVEDLCQQQAREPAPIDQAIITAAVTAVLGQHLKNLGESSVDQEKLQAMFDAAIAAKDQAHRAETDKLNAKVDGLAKKLDTVQASARALNQTVGKHAQEFVRQTAAQGASIAGLAATQTQQGAGLFWAYAILLVGLVALALSLSFFPYTTTPIQKVAAVWKDCRASPCKTLLVVGFRAGVALVVLLPALVCYGLYVSCFLLCCALVGLCVHGFFTAVASEDPFRPTPDGELVKGWENAAKEAGKQAFNDWLNDKNTFLLGPSHDKIWKPVFEQCKNVAQKTTMDMVNVWVDKQKSRPPTGPGSMSNI
jgi:hypothetical protein